MKVNGKDIVAIVNHAEIMIKMGIKQKELAKKLLTYAKKNLPHQDFDLVNRVREYSFRVDEAVYDLKLKLEKKDVETLIGCAEALDILSLTYELGELVKKLENLCYSLEKLLKSIGR